MTDTERKGQSIGLQTNSLDLLCMCKEFSMKEPMRAAVKLYLIIRNHISVSGKVLSEKKKQIFEDFASLLMEEFGVDTSQNDSVDCEGACARNSFPELLARVEAPSDLEEENGLRLMENECTVLKDGLEYFDTPVKNVDTSKKNTQTGTNTKTEDEPKGKEIESANHETSIEQSESTNLKASFELGAAASRDPQQIELGGATYQKASNELGAAASRDPQQIELGGATNQKASNELDAAADYEDIYTNTKNNNPQEKAIFNFCLGDIGGNTERKSKTPERKSQTPEPDVRIKDKAAEKKESTLGTTGDQPLQFPSAQRTPGEPSQLVHSSTKSSFRRPLQSGNFNYWPRQSEGDGDLEERTNSAPEATRYHQEFEQKFLSLDPLKRFPQIKQPIRIQSSGGQYYHGLEEFKNRNLRQNVTASMHESLMYHQIPERPTESVSNHQPRQYHSAPSPLNSSPEEAAQMARSSSERTLTSLPVARSSTLQADGFNFSSMTKSSPPSTNQWQSPSSGDAVPSSSSGRLVTDHAHAPAIPMAPMSGASGNSDSRAAATIADLNISDSKPNLTQKEEVNASTIALPEPQEQVASGNGSGENDLETDGSSVHVAHNDVLATMLRDDVTVEDPAASNTRPDETCHSAPELTRNLEERTPERNLPGENSVPSTNEETSATSRTQVRSTSSSEPLSGQNRRVLRAQRRNRLRQARNRSPSNRPPEGAEAASNRTHSRRSHSNNNQSAAAANDIVERFGLIVPEDEDENLDPEEIRKENQRLKNARLCQVCKDKDANRLFLPCAHLSSCSLCSPALTKCPQCKANIRGIVSVYFG